MLGRPVLLLVLVVLLDGRDWGAGTGERNTFIIASLTLALVISPFLNRLSINSVLLFPELRQAMLVVVRARRERMRVRI